jgi:hypothetical protein
MERNFLMQLIKRLQSENPKYWKIVSTIGLIGAFLVAGALFLESYDVFTLPENIEDLLKAIDGFFAGVFVSGQMGTTDPTLVDDKTKTNIAREVLK